MSRRARLLGAAIAIRNGTTYVNVHTSLFPGGEIRGRLDHHHN